MAATTSDRVSLDTALGILADPYRRRLLASILAHDSWADAEAPVPIDSPTRDGTVDGSTIGAVHVHLPTLEDTGFVRWNRTTSTVQRGPRFEEISPLLELLSDHADGLPLDWP